MRRLYFRWYYLLGLNCLHKELFDLKAYSNDKVFKNSLENVRKIGLDVAVLEERFDIDAIDDLSRLSRELEKGGFRNNINYNELRDRAKTILKKS
ncbi:MAG: hypothetical protein V1739_00495 [Candidatus Omnitrophota bacterium]